MEIILSSYEQKWAPPIGASVLHVGAFPDRPAGHQDRAGVIIVGRVSDRPDHCEIEWQDGEGRVRQQHMSRVVMETMVVGGKRGRCTWALSGIVLPIIALAYAFYMEIFLAPLTSWQVVALQRGSTIFVPIGQGRASQCGAIQLRPSASGASVRVARSAPSAGCSKKAGADRGASLSSEVSGLASTRGQASQERKEEDKGQGDMACVTSGGIESSAEQRAGEAKAGIEPGVWMEFGVDDAGLLISSPPGLLL